MHSFHYRSNRISAALISSHFLPHHTSAVTRGAWRLCVAVPLSFKDVSHSHARSACVPRSLVVTRRLVSDSNRLGSPPAAPGDSRPLAESADAGDVTRSALSRTAGRGGARERGRRGTTARGRGSSAWQPGCERRGAADGQETAAGVADIRKGGRRGRQTVS